jgi:transposase
MNEEGRILKRERFSNDPDSLKTFMKDLGEAKVVMESGYCWQPIYDHLEEAGYDVRLAHPLKVKVIAEAKIKTDEIDSETLAHLLRADLLPESYVPPREIRDLRELVKRRAFLVGMRTRLKNRIHAELAKRDVDLGTPLFTKQGRALLASLGIDAVSQLLPVMEALEQQIGEISGTLKRTAAEDGRARILTTILGVGYYTAMLLVSEVGDVGRFRGDKEFASWMGLVPSVHQSGEKTRIGGVSGPGNKRLRWALVESAQTAVRHDSRLGGMYERVSRRRGSGCAIVAVAHEMARIMYFMPVREEPYWDENRGLTERKLKNMGKKALDGLRN